jgi:hypothetical protein
MPNKPKTPISRFRIDADQWLAFGDAVPDGSDRSTVLREFIAWYLHQADEPPERPEKPKS